MINNDNYIINYCFITDYTALYSLISLKILVFMVIIVYIEFY